MEGVMHSEHGGILGIDFISRGTLSLLKGLFFQVWIFHKLVFEAVIGLTIILDTFYFLFDTLAVFILITRSQIATQFYC